MKNKELYIIPLLALVCGSATAAQRTMSEARALAQQALSHKLGHTVTLHRQPQQASLRNEATTEDVLPYYHFTDDASGAFVFIAGSDLMPAVIGYGDHWANDESMSPNMLSWLAQVEEAEQYLESHPEAAVLQQQALAQSSTYTPIEPLVPCHWGQTAPYNSLCPSPTSRQNAVGCMATALSQIMYSQRWPTQSYGQVTYKTLGVPMTVTFEGLTYNYDLMLDTYKGVEYTEEQKYEVAKLCYYVGAACKMQYGQESGTIEFEAIDGMRRHFGMTYAALRYRHYYSLNEWNHLLQTQLREGLPVLLTGQSSAGGHAFVIDGLDAQGFYHVNWGWDGQGDGYFDISILHTDMIGTGASANNGFNIENQALMNLCDPAKAKRWYCELGTHRTSTFSDYDQIWCNYDGKLERGSELNFETYPINYSYSDITGKAGVLLMKDGRQYDLTITDEKIEASGSFGTVDYNGNFSWWASDTEVFCKYTIPDDIADGKYLLYLVVQPEGETWVDAIRQYNYKPSYWTLTVQGDDLQLNQKRQPNDEVHLTAIEADDQATTRRTAQAYDLMGRSVTMPTGNKLSPGLYVIDGEKRVVIR